MIIRVQNSALLTALMAMTAATFHVGRAQQRQRDIPIRKQRPIKQRPIKERPILWKQQTVIPDIPQPDIPIREVPKSAEETTAWEQPMQIQQAMKVTGQSSPTVSPAPSTDLMQFDTSIPAADLVNDLLNSNGDVEVRNIQASVNIAQCAAKFRRGHTLGNLYQKDANNDLIKDADGNYIESNTPILMDEGIVLSSGSPAHLNWQDADDQTTKHAACSGNVCTDADLKASVDASNGWNNAVYDACVLQFQFRCTSDAYIPQVSFKYIFGSEEYYEYVNSAFNDVFGFYLNGDNIATLPTTDTNSDIVSINNVNYADNRAYFHGNDPGTGNKSEEPGAPDTEIVYPVMEADGFTDTLTAYGQPYTDAGRWNTIKLAVGDVGDAILDSWVVLEGASFTCVDLTEAPSISLQPSVGE